MGERHWARCDASSPPCRAPAKASKIRCLFARICMILSSMVVRRRKLGLRKIVIAPCDARWPMRSSDWRSSGATAAGPGWTRFRTGTTT